MCLMGLKSRITTISNGKSLTFSVIMQLTDAMTEARDTHRYLKHLDEAWEPLYRDLSIAQMQQLLPGLLSSIRTMQTVCRYAALALCFLQPQ